MSLVPLLIAYVLISIYKMLLVNSFFGTLYTFDFGIRNIANYQIAWYMGMYLCLFTLIPFLNKMWKALNEREQNILMITMIFLCAIYPCFNYIAPSYFVFAYPVMYYFIGVAIRDRQPVYNKFILLGIAAVAVALQAVISTFCTSTGMFDWSVISTPDGTYGTLFNLITGISIFLALYKVEIKADPIRKLLASISNVSFEIYLFAGAYDAIIYQQLKRTIANPPDFFWWFFVTVPLSFIMAYISSVIFSFVVKKILGLFERK